MEVTPILCYNPNADNCLQARTTALVPIWTRIIILYQITITARYFELTALKHFLVCLSDIRKPMSVLRVSSAETSEGTRF